MSTYLYDDAFVKKLKLWTEKTDVSVISPEETQRFLEMLSDKSGDKPIKLPIVALKRKGMYTVTNPSKKPLTFDGLMLKANVEKSTQLNAIPITLAYQIDIYTRYFKEADEYSRNLIFNIVNYPKLNIELPYEGMHIDHDANIRLSPDVENTSDIPERLSFGQFTRVSIGVDIDDAYLFDVRVHSNYSIDFKIIGENNELLDEGSSGITTTT